MPGRRWTSAEDAELRELVLTDRCTMREAATELGRTERACRNHYRRMRQRNPRLPRPLAGVRPDLRKRCLLIDLLGKGLRVNRAAAMLGVSSSTATRMAQQLARDGLLKRTGTATNTVRYRPSC